MRRRPTTLCKPTDEDHLMAAAGAVALNPARARLVERAQEWPCSRCGRILKGRSDGLVHVAPLLSRAAGRFADLLDEEPDAEKLAALRAAEPPVRARGRATARLEGLPRSIGFADGRNPRPGKPGRKSKPAAQTIRN
jgi:putative transposase